jgi:hypothetical protein
VVSLNEKQRREEKAELDAQVEARKKELSTRSVPPETAYEITLKNAEKPGLPNPLSDNNVASHRDADNEGADPADQSSGDQKDAPDLTLREARNILRDYIDLRTRGPGNTVAQHSAGDAN